MKKSKLTTIVFGMFIGCVVVLSGCATTSTPSLSERERTQLNQLLEHRAIESVVKGYALSMDTQNWDLHRALFTPEYQLYRRRGFITETIDKRIDRLSRFTQNYAWTQHLASIYSIEITGNTAFVYSSLQAKHGGKTLETGRQTNDYTMVGHYHYWLVKIDGQWKINKMRVKRFRDNSRGEIVDTANTES